MPLREVGLLRQGQLRPAKQSADERLGASGMRDLSDGRAVHLMTFRCTSMTDVEGGKQFDCGAANQGSQSAGTDVRRRRRTAGA